MSHLSFSSKPGQPGQHIHLLKVLEKNWGLRWRLPLLKVRLVTRLLERWKLTLIGAPRTPTIHASVHNNTIATVDVFFFAGTFVVYLILDTTVFLLQDKVFENKSCAAVSPAQGMDGQLTADR